MKRVVVLALVAGLIGVAHPASAAAACDGYVGLTFDDGPAAGNTPALLNALTTAGVRATMFNTGQKVQANPNLTRAQIAAGMWIGNHSWDHPHMTQLPAAEQASQISRTQDIVTQVAGVTPRLFRPPYLETNDALRTVERRFGLTEVNADVDSRDWDNATVDQIVAAAARMRSGDIILMHDWPTNTVTAIPRIASDLRARSLCAGAISPATGRAVAPDAARSESARSESARSESARSESAAHTVGRIDDTIRYTWPGVYFEGRFRGTGVGIVLDDAVNDYEVQVDSRAPVNVVKPGRTTRWISELPAGDHTVRVAKRTESPWTAGRFGGFVAAAGGTILSRPSARSRQIEFIGDSWTAGYGDTSTVRDCAGTGGIDRNTNADQSFGARTARGLDADYQINAWSGMGMVRNYNGGNAGVDYRTYYDRTLQAVDTSVWPPPANWKPQVVVIGLGINDFSTALHSGEPWAGEAALAADFRTAYLAFLDRLRARYGSDTYLVLTYPYLSNTSALTDSIGRIVQQRNAAGDQRVRSLYYDNNALGLDLLGCDWHPSARDHRLLAAALTTFVNGLALNW